MGEELEVAVMKQTQETLGKIIKRPPLTEKLLKKPPFRFLHDIITNVIKTTGFMKDLYTGDELNAENIKDKEAKISFLQKAIDVVVIVTGDSLTIRPAKVVAGHEADKTNEFLQALAKATRKKEEGKEAVQRVKNGLKPPKPSKKRDASRDKASREIKEKSESKERIRSKTDDSKNSKKEKTSRDLSKKPPSNKEARSSKDSSKSSSREKGSLREKGRSRSKDGDAENQKASGDEPKPEEIKSPSRITSASPSHIPTEENTPDLQGSSEETAALTNGDVDSPITLPSEELQSSPQKVTSQGDSPSIARPTTGRPTTARPGTGRPSATRPPSAVGKKPSDSSKHQRKGPKREQSLETMESDEPPARPLTSMNRLRSARPSSARPPPPVLRSRRPVEDPVQIEPVNSVANVIVENEKDDDNAFVVEEPTAPLAGEDFVTAPSAPAVSTDLNVESGEHGSLVTQILQTKKDLETGSQQPQQVKRTEIDKSLMTDASRKKEKDFVGREIDKMRSSIQTLTRSVNPLGKMIDYLQEDVDSMQKELETWQKENLLHVQALKREQSNLESNIEPLKSQLQELDQAIEDQLDKISSVKANILRNEEKIQKLLSNSKS